MCITAVKLAWMAIATSTKRNLCSGVSQIFESEGVPRSRPFALLLDIVRDHVRELMKYRKVARNKNRQTLDVVQGWVGGIKQGKKNKIA